LGAALRRHRHHHRARLGLGAQASRQPLKRGAALLLAPLAALLLGGAAQPKAEAAASGQRIRAYVTFLASDALGGRDTGSPGHAAAAAYVADQFKSLGLKPGGDKGGWFQQVPFRHASHAAAPRITYAAGGRKLRWKSGRDFALRPSLTRQHRRIDAPLVFAGHGISDAKLGIDEYAGLDARGKIVVVLRGVPDGLADDIEAHLEVSKEQVAARHGAAGIAEISAGHSGISWFASRPIIDWAAGAQDAGAQGDLAAVLTLSPDVGKALFEGAARSFQSVRRAGNAAIAGFPLPGRLSISSETTWQDFKSPNVVAVLPGADPALRNQYVVVGGHLDHLGMETGARPGEDAIFNGAMDNAAGVATLIETARSFVASRKPPRRSVMFIATTGEERGLLGADYFAAHPTVTRQAIVSLVDLDMPLLTYAVTDVVAFGADESTIGKTVAEAAASMQVRVSPDPMPDQSLFVRSDHYRFVLRGIPALFLMTGQANGGKAAWDDYFARFYHRVGDDLSQPFRWEAGAKFAELNYRIARRLADSDEPPRWYAGSYFGDRYAAGAPKAAQ
jgi:Zn-dependent M28 family amino/carboxypeptidase